MSTNPPKQLAVVLEKHPEVLFAALVGSRAQGVAREGSDWDIALWWSPEIE